MPLKKDIMWPTKYNELNVTYKKKTIKEMFRKDVTS